MNKMITLILILILLQLPVLFLQTSLEPTTNIEQNTTSELTNYSTSQSLSKSLPLTEGNEHGGSWLDSFMDTTGFNLSLSDNINTSYDEVKLVDTKYIKVLDETFSTPLNSTTWINNTGGGTTVYSHPELKAVKNYKAQPFEAYIETNKSWNFLRIVEWNWNSVLDSATNSYGHQVGIFKGENKRLYVGINADRKVHIGDGIKYYLYQSTNALNKNQWYKMRFIIETDHAEFEVRDLSNNLVMNATVVSSIFPLNPTGSADISFASKSSRSDFSFETRVDNFRLYEKKFYPEGNLTSNIIQLPKNMKWDTFIINRSETLNNSIKFSLLNATSNLPIPGFDDISFNNEDDISELNSIGYRSLRLKAHFQSDSILSPRLFYWGVSWKEQNVWRDTFFRSERVNSSTGIEIIDGNSQCEAQLSGTGYLNSSIVEVPNTYHFDTLIVNLTKPNGTDINISIIDAVTNVTLAWFTDNITIRTDISSIDTALHPKIRLEAKLQSNSGLTPIIYDWSVNWVQNKSSQGKGCVDIDPDTLNLKSKGRWITCYIEPKDGSDPAGINISTVFLNGTIPAELHPATIGDYDNDSLPDLMVKFNRSDVQEIVSVGDNVTLYVEGYYNDGRYFKCSDTIRVINPPDEKNNHGKGKDKNK